MKKIITPDELPSKTFLTRTYQGHTIYLLGEGLKYKEYDSENDFYSISNKPFYQGLKNQIEETSALVAFPTSLVMEKSKLYGVVSPYIPGIPIQEINPQISISTLLKQITKLEKEIERLTQKGWFLDDINSDNIITNNQKDNLVLTIIDTDFYVKRKKVNYEELIKLNRKQLVNTILTAFAERIMVSKLIKDKKIEKAYILAINGFISASEFIVILLDRMNRYIEVDTIESFRKSI
jgi:hypothetical protein